MEKIWLLVGLGNPGSSYQNHRHNVGFQVLDALVDNFLFPPWNKKKDVALTWKDFDQGRLLLCKPQSYMNLSGQPLRPLVRSLHLPLTQMVVFHDEIDLDFGIVKWKTGGSARGHNGLKSLTQCLGQEYHRVRIGVGHPGPKEEVAQYVLSDFSTKEKEHLTAIFESTCQAIPFLVKNSWDSFSEAMKRFLQTLET